MIEPFESQAGHKLMAVRWLDASSDNDRQYRPEQIKKLTPVNSWTVGWGFVLEDKIVMAAQYFPESPEFYETYRVTFVISMECVKQIIELTLKGGSDDHIL